MNSYETIIELSKSLVRCPYKADRAVLRDIISDLHVRELKGIKSSRIEEIEARLNNLSNAVNLRGISQNTG